MNLTIYRNGEIQRHYPQIGRCVRTSDGTLKVYLVDEHNQLCIHEYPSEYYDWFELGDK